MNFLFDPDLSLFLQSFHNPILTIFMLIVSGLGSRPFLLTATVFLLFYSGLKRALPLVHTLLWSFIIVDFLKLFFGLPRPAGVNSSILLFNEYYPDWIARFFPLKDNPGFPSGHVCSSVVFWGSLLFLFPNKFQKIASLSLIVLMPLSRMYLGRHFLGDVLGGLLIGILILYGSALLIHLYDKLTPKGKRLAIIFYCLLPLPLFFTPNFNRIDLALLSGFNIAFFAVKKDGKIAK